MTRSELVEKLLREKGRFTMGEIARDHPAMVYTIRNGVAEVKAKFAGEGFKIVHVFGKSWQENAYELVKLEEPKEDDAMALMACIECGGPFEARARDVKDGQGRLCSRRCAGRRGARLKQASRKEGEASQVIPAAQRALL